MNVSVIIKCGPDEYQGKYTGRNRLEAVANAKKAAYRHFSEKHKIYVRNAETLIELTNAVEKIPYRVRIKSVEEQ